MSARGMKTNSQVLRDLIKIVGLFNTGQQEVLQMLNHGYSDLGSEWYDHQYEKAGEIISIVSAKMKGVEGDLENLHSHLKNLLEIVSRYEEIRS